MKKSLIAVAALSAVALCASVALAENRGGAFNLTPVIGGYHWDGTQPVDANMLYGLKAGYNFTDRLGMEGLLHYMHTKEYSFGSENTMDAINYRLEGLYHFTPQKRFVPFLAFGIGGLRSYFNSDNYDDSGLVSYGAGVKYALSDNVALRGDARMMSVFYNPSVVYNYEYTLGLNFQFGGVSKIAKAAPAPKPVAAPEPVAAPAPKPVPVAAVPKQAPAAPVVIAPPPAPKAYLSANPATIEKNASTTLAWSAENASECSIVPGVGSAQPKGNKVVSPEVSTTYKLVCKGAGGTAESSATVNVNQPPLDSDKDGITDALDKCPNTPLGTKVDNDGCPVVECKSVTLSITFENNSAKINQRHHDELKNVADKLSAFPKATVVIEGHTDSVGPEKANMKLSQRRAESVRKYITTKFGVKADRITAKGFGESKPIDSNKTKEGRKNNRRVVATFTCPE
jgi:OOP family OmpA-OmpF porin